MSAPVTCHCGEPADGITIGAPRRAEQWAIGVELPDQVRVNCRALPARQDGGRIELQVIRMAKGQPWRAVLHLRAMVCVPRWDQSGRIRSVRCGPGPRTRWPTWPGFGWATCSGPAAAGGAA